MCTGFRQVLLSTASPKYEHAIAFLYIILAVMFLEVTTLKILLANVNYLLFQSNTCQGSEIAFGLKLLLT